MVTSRSRLGMIAGVLWDINFKQMDVYFPTCTCTQADVINSGTRRWMCGSFAHTYTYGCHHLGVMQMSMLRIRDDNRPASVANIAVTVEKEDAVSTASSLIPLLL